MLVEKHNTARYMGFSESTAWTGNVILSDVVEQSFKSAFLSQNLEKAKYYVGHLWRKTAMDPCSQPCML